MDCPSFHMGPSDTDGIFLTDLRWEMLGYVVLSHAPASILHMLVPLLGVRPCANLQAMSAMSLWMGSVFCSHYPLSDWVALPTEVGSESHFCCHRVHMVLKGLLLARSRGFPASPRSASGQLSQSQNPIQVAQLSPAPH